MKVFLVYSIDDGCLEVYGCRVNKYDAEFLREKEGAECDEPTEIFIEEIDVE